MTRKSMQALALITGALTLAGCATTSRNYQADIDSLNSRITALQAQLSEKDQEAGKLRSQMGDQEARLKNAESEKRELSDKLNAAIAKLEASVRKPMVNPEESDLK